MVITGAGTGIGKDRRVHDGDLLTNVGVVSGWRSWHACLASIHPFPCSWVANMRPNARRVAREPWMKQKHRKGRSVPVSHLVFTSRCFQASKI